MPKSGLLPITVRCPFISPSPQVRDPAGIPKFFAVMGRLAGGGFDEPSARDARRRILAFFPGHLKA